MLTNLANYLNNDFPFHMFFAVQILLAEGLFVVRMKSRLRPLKIVLPVVLCYLVLAWFHPLLGHRFARVAAIFAESLLVLCLTIIGTPFGLQAFKMGLLALFPFGQQTVVTEQGSGCLSTLMNILWFFVGGIWIALSHLFWGVLLCITIIGIPFGRQHFKLMSLSFTPFGRDIVRA